MKLGPVVFNPTADPPFQRLQPQDDLAAPTLEDRIGILEEKVEALSRALLHAGLELEDVLTGDL